MKRLTLVRHAKSSWTEVGRADHDRVLSDRGERDAPRMGKRLAARKVRPSLIVTSSATRARRTGSHIAEAMNYPAEFLQVEKDLYLASPETILDLVCGQEDNFSDLMVIGHNPGMTDLVNHLLPSMELNNLQTGGVVAIDIATRKWSEITSAEAKLAFYDFPKNSELLLIED
ncbi:MAG: SixA phosphatase family protein [Candidatus Rariloculaceae bacterium]